MKLRRRCAEPGCRHSPRAHGEGGCALCSCAAWEDRHPHTWRDDVTEAWLLATETWLAELERVAVGYPTEMADFERNHPRPRLADFMKAMSPGEPPERLAELTKPPVCSACCGTGHNLKESA